MVDVALTWADAHQGTSGDGYNVTISRDFARALLPSLRALLAFRVVDAADALQRAGSRREAAAAVALALHLMHPEPPGAPE